MTTFRVTVVFDYEVPDGEDPDEFHDNMRDNYEAGMLQVDAYQLESVRDIDVEVLSD